jgi:hypothetical protein
LVGSIKDKKLKKIIKNKNAPIINQKIKIKIQNKMGIIIREIQYFLKKVRRK